MTENTIKYCTTFEDGTMITPYSATAFAEGFCEGDNQEWGNSITENMIFSSKELASKELLKLCNI